MQSAGGTFELAGTIGQPDAGVLAGGVFELSGGFWFGVQPGDCDSNGIVDLLDYQGFAACATGPEPKSPLPVECRCYDLDLDDDVDLADFSRFQRAFGQ